MRHEEMTIPERIKLVRETFNLSQTEFGERLGITRSMVSNIEYDKLKRPDQKEPVYKLICQVFKVSITWLKTGEGEMFVLEEPDEFMTAIATIDKDDPKARQAILMYWKLSDEDKKLVWNFIERFFKK